MINFSPHKIIFLFVCSIFAVLKLPAQVVAGFTANAPIPNCNPAVYSFSNTSTGTAPLTYEWNFGVYPGVNSIFKDPGTTYLGCGPFRVKLVVTDATGQKDSIIKTINVFCSPNANFSVGPTAGCVPFTANFTDRSAPGSGNITKYLWDFGDGYTATTASPSHAYNIGGCKNVTLVITNSNNCTSDTTLKNVVCTYALPASNFTSSTHIACTLPLNVAYQATSSGGSGAYIYQWLFPGGTPATSTVANPTVQYNSVGSFPVTLITQDAKGCIDTIVKNNYTEITTNTADFTVSALRGCANATITTSGIASSTPQSWKWTTTPASSISNGNAQNASFLFASAGSYDICLDVTYRNGCVERKCTTIVIQPAPVANFTISGLTRTCITPNPITFNNTSTGTNLTYAWVFDGGFPSSSTAASPVINYSNCGFFSASLTVKDDLGCTATKAVPTFLNIVCPVTSFSATPIQGCNPLTTTFSSATTTGPPVSWQWDFGDPSSGSKNTSNLQSPTHTYILPGCYDVTLTTTTAEGCVTSKKVTSAVCTDHKPHANFSGNPAFNCVRNPVYFTDSSTDTYEYTEYFWDFHGAPYTTESSERNPSFVYSDTGYVDVTLIVSNRGCADTLTKDNYIYLLGPVSILHAFNECGGHFQVKLDGTPSIAAHSYEWFVPDGTPSSAFTPVVNVSFTTPGVHTASLKTTNDSTGCTDVNAINFIVSALKADFTAAPLSGCSPVRTCIANTSVGAVRYRWFVTDSIGNAVDTSSRTSPCFTLIKPGTYGLRLVASDSLGCSDTLYRQNYIHVNGAVANFVGQPLSGCAPLNVNFNDLTIAPLPISTYSWNFGDNSSGVANNSSLRDPVHTYNQPGKYLVSLKVTDQAGCTDDTLRNNYITVYKPVATIISSLTNTCAGTLACFTGDTSQHALTYHWDFGDSTSSDSLRPCHNYAVKGIFPVTLIVEDTVGCQDTAFANTTVNVINPNPGFIADTTFSTCPPLQVSFTNLSTSVDAQSTYLWDFGDGQFSSAKDPSHIYGIPGIFDITLVVRNSNGCTDTLIYPEYIHISGPTAYISTPPTSGCAPNYTCFKAISQSTASYTWNFGDGSVVIGSDSICYNYERSGTFFPELILSDGLGCIFSLPIGTVDVGGAFAYFTRDNSFLCTAGTVHFSDSSFGVWPVTKWQWDFGEPASGAQNISSLQNPSHFYSTTGVFDVTLKITTSDGCTNTFVKQVTSGGAPQVQFAVLDTPLCSGHTVSFSDRTVSSNPITIRIWNFGDPTSGAANASTLTDPTHYYANPGTYIITLIESGDNGCADTLSRAIIIHQQVTAAFTKLDTCLNTQPIFFSNQSQFADRYQWNFGDNNVSQQQAPSHIYSSDGDYNVTLVAQTDFCVDTATAVVKIYPVPDAAFTLPANALCGPLSTLQPTNTSTGATTYLWTFGNGDSSVQAEPIIAYTTPGEYTIVLLASNIYQCIDTTSLIAAAHPKPLANFGAQNTCFNTQPVLFTDSSQATTYYNWYFGDGQSAQSPTPSHTYADSGIYSVTLIASTNFCTDTFVAPVQIFPAPHASFNLPFNSLCGPPATVTPVNTSTGATTYLWNFGNSDTSVLANPSITYHTPGDYTLTLKAQNSYLCQDTASASISIHQKVIAAFAVPDTCLNTQPVTLINQTEYATVYDWNLGNNTSSSQFNPVLNYASAGEYTITLHARNDFCSDSASKTLQIFPVPDAAFTLPALYLCGPPASILPTNNSTGATSYMWQYGTDSSNLIAPNITFTSPGDYVIFLTAVNQYGCMDTASKPFVVHPYPAIQNIEITPAEGCEPLTVNLSANVSDGHVFTWSFGDHTPDVTSSTPDALHTYIDTGNYTIALHVTSLYDCNSSVILTDTIKVHVFPTADFDYNLNTNVEPVNGTVVFINKSKNADSYSWDFGDGSNTTDTDPAHMYERSDSFEVILVAHTAYGCADSILKKFEVLKKTLYVPNAFAPDYNNGDGLVRIWQPVGTGLKEYHAQIFNTWGELLWESRALTEDKQPAEGWDGTYQGKPCQQDAYVWKVEAIFKDGTIWEGMSYRKGERKRTIGSVTLIR